MWINCELIKYVTEQSKMMEIIPNDNTILDYTEIDIIYNGFKSKKIMMKA